MVRIREKYAEHSPKKPKKNQSTKINSRNPQRSHKNLPQKEHDTCPEENKESTLPQKSLCSLCGEVIKCHAPLAKAECSECHDKFHRRCIAFLPHTTGVKSVYIKCPVCLFVAEKQSPVREGNLAKEPCSKLSPIDTFRIKGIYVFPSPVMHLKHVHKLSLFVSSVYKRYMESFRRQKAVKSLKIGFSNFRERSSGRYEIILPNLYDMISRVAQKASNNENCKATKPSELPVWIPLIQSILGNHYSLMASGIFISVPGAKNQPFHMDGPPLSDKYNLPTHAVNLFIPLVEVDEHNGTQFEIGSHLSATKNDLPGAYRAQSSSKRRELIVPHVCMGGAFLFDYKVWHRGLANDTKYIRPCLYFTFVKDWYSDCDNFSSKRYSKQLDVSLSDDLAKLLNGS